MSLPIVFLALKEPMLRGFVAFYHADTDVFTTTTSLRILVPVRTNTFLLHELQRIRAVSYIKW